MGFIEAELPLSSVFPLSHVFSVALPTVESFPANGDDGGHVRVGCGVDPGAVRTSGLSVIGVTNSVDPAAPVDFISVRVALGGLGGGLAGGCGLLPVETVASLLSLSSMDASTPDGRTLGLLCVPPFWPCGAREGSALAALSANAILGPLGSRWSGGDWWCHRSLHGGSAVAVGARRGLPLAAVSLFCDFGSILVLCLARLSFSAAWWLSWG